VVRGCRAETPDSTEPLSWRTGTYANHELAGETYANHELAGETYANHKSARPGGPILMKPVGLNDYLNKAVKI